MSGADVLPFILCGGAGTRLWPLSREAFPKQFHKAHRSAVALPGNLPAVGRVTLPHTLVAPS